MNEKGRLGAIIVIMVAAFVLFSESAAQISIQGSVKDTEGNAISGAVVILPSRGVSTLSDAEGNYSIVASPVMRGRVFGNQSTLVYRNGRLNLQLERDIQVKLELFRIDGKLLSVLADRKFSAGAHVLTVDRAYRNQMLLMRAFVGRQVFMGKLTRFSTQPELRKTAKSTGALAFVDTIRASKAGFKAQTFELTSEQGTVDFVLERLQSDVGTSPIDDGSADRIARNGIDQYFWGEVRDEENRADTVPLVKITTAVSDDAVDMAIVFNPGFVDNTYGTGSVGWSPRRGHTWKDLHGSDHVEIAAVNGDGDTVFHGRIDLISATQNVSSGYACLGVTGGDGTVYKGSASDIISFGSSLCDNINYYGYSDLVNSPTTDSTYAPNPEYPYFQFYTAYRITFKPEIFGESGFGEVRMTSVHASPAKTSSDTIEVTEKPGPEKGSKDDPFRFYNPPSDPGDPTDPGDPGDPTDPGDPGDPGDPTDPPIVG